MNFTCILYTPEGRAYSVLFNKGHNFEQTAQNGAMQILQLGNTRARLVIDCATPEQAGEYTCVAQTPTERHTRENMFNNYRQVFTTSTRWMHDFNVHRGID
jgi:hypothetical protein